MRPAASHLRATALCAALAAVLPAYAQDQPPEGVPPPPPPGTEPPPSTATRIDWQAGFSLMYSDNIGLSENNTEDDFVASPQVSFTASRNSSALRLQARGSLAFVDYLGDTFSDEFRGDLAGQLEWVFSPDRAELVVRDTLSREPIDTLRSFSPGNQQEVNVFVAGPRLLAHFGPATTGKFDLRYGNTYAQDDPTFNGDRWGAAATLERDLSETDQIGAVVEYLDARFDDQGSSDYTLTNAYASYTRDRPALYLNLDLGGSRMDRRDRPSETGSLVRAEVDWYVSPRSTLSANVRHQFSDPAQYLLDRIDTPELALPGLETMGSGVEISGGVFREHYVEVAYHYAGDRVSFDLRPYYNRTGYFEQTAPSQHGKGVLLAIDYRLRQLTHLVFTAERENQSFDDLSRDDHDLTATIALLDQLTRHWSWRVDLQHRERDSTAPGQGYDENSIFLAFVYRR